ncbi:MAG TPA: hypothetical protein P5186_23820 [Candidatus Paceibacterota bacterium]|nr:hypothetical protein [Verrucomicrobiota bacterium]HRY51088.1 hypothetical protein [Candidatus Paceibacterota bacterium]
MVRNFFPLWQVPWKAPAVAFLLATGTCISAAPPGPTPQIPEGGAAPGAFPNTSVSAVNVIAKGSTTFNSSVEVSGLNGQGPVSWSVNRYNRGDFALRMAPGNPTAALDNLGQGFIEFGDSAPSVAASQAWRPSRLLGLVLPTARQNGPVDWGDGEGPFFPTVALSEASSGPGFSMVDGSFGNGDLDINTGRAGTHSSSPEANFSFSAAWFPYDQGWLGGEVAGPGAAGASSWTAPGAHAAGLSAGLVKWLAYPADTETYAGLAELRLPGVDSLEDGMVFATSADGGSDVNIVGVAPMTDGAGWVVTIREDEAADAETLAAPDQSEFQFLYVPFSAQRLIGGHVVGVDGSKRKASGDFTIVRTGTGTYELTVPGKTGADGTLLLQVADFEAGTSVPLASRAFLSYEYKNGKFMVQSRKTTSDTMADLADANFYFAWVDFQNPLAPPEGPRLRSLAAVAVSGEGMVAKDSSVAPNTDASEVLVTFVDSVNVGGYLDPITQQPATMAMMGRFYDAATLVPTSEPFIIFGHPVGTLNRCDAKYNPVSKQYVVVANARAYGTLGNDVPLVALVNPASIAGANSPVAKAWVHDPDSDQSYDDVAVAVSSKNGNFLLVAERKAADEGESTVGALYDKAGTRLTPLFTRLDLLQSVGDEDDPDVIYHAGMDGFLYYSNTDNSNGSTGTLGNRVVGSIVDAAPDGQGKLVVRAEQVLSDGLPAGTPEGHPAAIMNPFNGQLIVAYDAGNGTAHGDLSYFNLGAAPNYVFTSAREEVPYLDGTTGNPFNHQHPQLAADPDSGVIVVGYNATGSTVGLPEAYVFRLLGPDGLPLPSQLGAPYFLADSPGGLGTSVNFHNIKYSPVSKSFLAAFTSNPGVTYLAALAVTSSHLTPVAPVVSITAQGGNVIVTFTGVLQVAPAVDGPWADTLAASPLTEPASGGAKFYRSKK